MKLAQVAIAGVLLTLGAGCSGGGSDKPSATAPASVAPTATAMLPNTALSRTVTAAPTAAPTLVPEPAATEDYPPLPPPPPRPDNPTLVTQETLVGGQWYRLPECLDFYLPAGWTFRLAVGIADPGGGFMIFREDASGSSISFVPGSLNESGRTVLDPALGPVFDQIASTMERSC